MSPNNVVQGLVDGLSRHLSTISFDHSHRSFQQLPHPVTRGRRNKSDRGKLQERQSILYLIAILFDIAIAFRYQVPFVDRQEQRLATLNRVAENLRVLIGDSFRSVDDVENQIATVDRSQGAADAEAFNTAIDARFAANASGVNQNTC